MVRHRDVLMAMSLVCLTMATSACLPPPRPNEPLPEDAATTQQDAAAEDDAASAADTLADDAGASAGDVAGDVAVDAVALPQGCTADTDCAAKPAAACKVWRCNKKNGQCSVQANAKLNTSCDDGNACTSDDKCNSSGLCNLGKQTDCDDQNLCTQDSCDKQKGGCVYINKTDTNCDDGDKCTGPKNSDKCVDGTCVGEPVVCSGTGSCKDWSCNDKTGECVGAVVTGDNVSCDDGDLCTTKDTCQKSGKCLGVGWLQSGQCDDNNKCTDDSCNPKTGCFSIALVGQTKECTNDGDQCVEAGCTGGKCVTTPKTCDPSTNPCGVNSCDPKDGKCAPKDKKDGTACEDLKKCLSALCVSGVCADQAKKMECNDANACTDDACKPGVGCEHKPNTKACVDGNACTSDDKCTAGVCGGTKKDCSDGNECTVDSCDNLTAECSHANAKDGTKCAGGVCASGKCGS